MRSRVGLIEQRVIAVLFLVAAIVFSSRLQAQDTRLNQAKEIIPENYLPKGAGRDLIFQACVQCHDLRNTVSQRKTAGGWKRTVDEMIWRGAPLMTDEAETVTKYLASSFGPDKPIPEELKSKLAGSKR